MFPHFLFIGYDSFFYSAVFIFFSLNKAGIHNSIVEILWTLGEACFTIKESFCFFLAISFLIPWLKPTLPACVATIPEFLSMFDHVNVMPTPGFATAFQVPAKHARVQDLL